VVKFLEQNKIIEKNQARFNKDMRMEEYLIGYTAVNMVISQEKINVCSYQPRKGI